MSKMSELSIEIQQLLSDGYSPTIIAQALGIPLSWVTAADDFKDADQEFEDVPF